VRSAAVCTFALALASGLAAETLLVLNKEGNVAMVDPATQKVLAHVPAGEGPHEIVATADGKLAVVSNYGGHTLSVIDLASRRELRRVDLSPLSRPHGLFAAGGRIYFTAESNRMVGRYDPASNRVDWKIGTGQDGTHMVMLNRAGTMMFTSNFGSGSISIFERAGGTGDWHQTNVPTGPGVEGFDISPDEKQLWAANAGDGTVSIIDSATKKIVEAFNAGARRSNRLKFTPDGRRVLISDLASGELLVIDASTKKMIKRIRTGSGSAGILVQPDGSRAYVAATNDNHVAIVDLKTLEMIGQIQTGRGPDGMDWVK
jgi:YVTN family beta-propeller protein